jgi:ubiquinone/menaquinone biosynthesis C-methylase UbiE
MPNNAVTPERILQMSWGYAPTLIIEAAIRNGIFDALDRSPLTLEQLAKKTGASKRGIAAAANALVGLQFLTRRGDRYALTPESAAFLVSTKPTFQGAIFRHQTGEILPKWMELSKVVRTGKPAMAVNRKPAAKFFANFVEALFPMGYHAARNLAEHLRVAKAKQPMRVLDLAAGSGVWGIALAQSSPHVTVTAVDWPEVLRVTKKVAGRQGVGRRLTTIAGNIQKVPFGSGYQVATLGHILHSEGAQSSRKLLRKTFAALAPGGTIVIAEFVPNDERTGPPGPLIFAVNMLVNTDQGDTFTFAEMSQWLREAGFVKPRQLDAGGVSPLILATKAHSR